MENDKSTLINAEAIQIDQLIVASIVAAILLTGLFIWTVIISVRKKKKKGGHTQR